MNTILLALVFLALALAGVVVRKTYYSIPVKELKRRAARRDEVAEQLYRAVSYGSSARTLLWLYIGFTSAVSVVLLARELPVWVSLLIVGPILYIVFSFVPASRVTSLGQRLSMYATPIITWILNYGHPMLSRGAEVVEKRYTEAHTKLFEREDLLELIAQQQRQVDSRFTTEELEIAKRALQFDEHKVADVMTLKTEVKAAIASDTLGPILIDELHKSEQDFVLVRESAKGKFVGHLPIKQLGIKTTGKVSDVMQQPVYYLHEDDTLSEALHAFFVTNHPLFLVVNSFEEFVGIVTVESILKQLLGHVPGNDFDQYADLQAVASRHGTHESTASDPIKTEEEVVE